MDKIARIRAEIERRKQSLRAGICNPDAFTRKQKLEMLVASEELDRLNRFLDTLSEQPSKSLEEAAEEWAENEAYGKSDAEFEMAYKAFIAGAEWQKEQMLKDAYVESQIVEDGRIELEGEPLPCLNPIILLPYPQFEPGDKVRIIIVKEEE